MFSGDLMKLIEQYRRNIVLKSISKRPRASLFEYIVGVFSGKFDDTDNESSNQSNEMTHWDDDDDELYGPMVDKAGVEMGSDEFVDGPKAGLKASDSFDYKAHTP